MTKVLLLLLLGSSLAGAQTRFIIRVFDANNTDLNTTVSGVGGTNIIRNLNYPGLRFNGVVALVQNDSIDQMRNTLDAQYLGNYRFIPDPLMQPNEGSGDDLTDPISPTPASSNPALDSLVPGRPIAAPPSGPITGKVIVEILGTGIDQSHPDLAGLVFETPLSVMFAGSGGFLPADFDYHNHETRLAGCIAGTHTGLLTALGTRSGASYRSVLFYDKPAGFGPSIPSTYVSDAIAALSEVIFAHETRLATPYLRNHAAVLCFSHSVEIPGTRVGDLDALFDLAWERGIVTSISAGNHGGTAAASSPAGAGEWVAFDKSGDVVTNRYWPPLGAPSYDLPGTVGFETTGEGSDYHLKSGAHDNTISPGAWTSGGGTGTALNTPNPSGYGPTMNQGVDLFSPGDNIKVPATRLDPTTGTGPIVVDGSTYYLEQGYQTGAGTSYSAAYTAALAARILQLRPWASPSQVRTAILATGGGSFNVLALPNLTTLDPMSLTYSEWLARYEEIAGFGYFDEGMDAKLADPDGDGVANFIEYFCGMDPRYADSQHAPKVTLDKDTLTFKVEMQSAAYLPHPAEVEWSFQSSEDLDTWNDVGQGTVTKAAHLPLNGDGVNLAGTLTFTTVDLRKFFRFRITSTP
jgi:hypothetical protein